MTEQNKDFLQKYVLKYNSLHQTYQQMTNKMQGAYTHRGLYPNRLKTDLVFLLPFSCINRNRNKWIVRITPITKSANKWDKYVLAHTYNSNSYTTTS